MSHRHVQKDDHSRAPERANRQLRRHLKRFWFGHDEGDGRSRGRRRRGGSDGGGRGGRGGPFGGRRPLRFLSRALDLDDEQFAALTVLFSALKTERAQTAVDRRRAGALYAEAFGDEAFDASKAAEAARVSAAAQARFDECLAEALGKLHALLDPRQRTIMAGLLRETPLTSP